MVLLLQTVEERTVSNRCYSEVLVLVDCSPDMDWRMAMIGDRPDTEVADLVLVGRVPAKEAAVQDTSIVMLDLLDTECFGCSAATLSWRIPRG